VIPIPAFDTRNDSRGPAPVRRGDRVRARAGVSQPSRCWSRHDPDSPDGLRAGGRRTNLLHSLLARAQAVPHGSTQHKTG